MNSKVLQLYWLLCSYFTSYFLLFLQIMYFVHKFYFFSKCLWSGHSISGKFLGIRI